MTMRRISVASLLSPPEAKPFESFNSSYVRSEPGMSSIGNNIPSSARQTMSQSNPQSQSQSRKMDLPSPPITPNTKKLDDENKKSSTVDTSADTTTDPLLFPHNYNPVSTIANRALFVPDIGPDVEPIVRHVEKRPRYERQLPLPVPTGESRLIVERRKTNWTPTVMGAYNSDPAGYAMTERRILDRQMASGMQRYAATSGLAKIAPAPAKNSPNGYDSSSSSISRPRRKQRARKRARAATPVPQTVQQPVQQTEPSTKPVRPTVPRKQGSSKKKDPLHTSVIDISPPLETLEDGRKPLWTTWKPPPQDNTGAPFLEKLHPSERQVASILRLSPNQYLYSKRRIFEAFVEKAQAGEMLNKTGAQGACHIDVNKASRLFTCFQRTGWFDLNLPHWREYFDANVIEAARARKAREAEAKRLHRTS